jgi:GNAT superfamily N-acetyltransferase
MTPRDLIVGLANASDAQAMSVMSRDLIEAGLGWEYRRDRVAAMIVDKDTTAIVTRDGPRVAGFAIMTFGAERGHLALLAVRPSHQRCGIAHRMVAWLTETALVAGAASLHVELRVTNLAALASLTRRVVHRRPCASRAITGDARPRCAHDPLLRNPRRAACGVAAADARRPRPLIVTSVCWSRPRNAGTRSRPGAHRG